MDGSAQHAYQISARFSLDKNDVMTCFTWSGPVCTGYMREPHSAASFSANNLAPLRPLARIAVMTCCRPKIRLISATLRAETNAWAISTTTNGALPLAIRTAFSSPPASAQVMASQKAKAKARGRSVSGIARVRVEVSKCPPERKSLYVRVECGRSSRWLEEGSSSVSVGAHSG